MSRILASLALVLTAALPAAGQLPGVPLNGIANATVSGNTVSFTIELPGDIGADVTLAFDNVVGLTVANLGLSARLINPLDPGLLARLPGGTIPLAFPVLLRIEPPRTGGLSFSGIVSLEIHTHNLQFVTPCPLRLFDAPIGGPFEDITAGMGTGSYRARGTAGGFSEFLIAVDLRTVDQVIAAKLDRLDQILADNAGSITPSIQANLAARLTTIRADAQHGSTQTAIQDVNDFLAYVQQKSGNGIPNVWRSARDLVDVAGLLRSEAMTLQFSLGLKSDLGL